MSVSDWVTVAAIILGPVFGAWFAIEWGERRMKQERKLHVFRMLMGTRRAVMSPEHVQALNLIEIEYADEPKVVGRWHDLLQHFADPQPKQEDETVTDEMTQEAKSVCQSKFDLRLSNERQKLLAKLLQEMGKKQGFDLEQFDISEGGYYPVGFENIDLQQQAIRRFFVDIYLGNRVFPISVRELQEQQAQETGN
ncbi:MAG: hypothetical protein IID51_13505 [Proteobacteria bacterium]|nr:hypothetical protein [Pseudomonadota bacterium]